MRRRDGLDSYLVLTRPVGISTVLALGCNALTGVDEYQFGPGGGGAGGVVTATTSATVVPEPCPAQRKRCGDECVSVNDPAYGCDGTACLPCAEGHACCGGCTDTALDPKRCGGCNAECSDDEWCTMGACACRPGLVMSGPVCVDPLTNPGNCGGVGPCTGATPACQGGVCVATCSGATTDCDGACVDLDVDPLHCGTCEKRCNKDQICAQGECRGYVALGSCSQCPCPECDEEHPFCCTYPGTTTLICVKKDAAACP